MKDFFNPHVSRSPSSSHHDRALHQMISRIRRSLELQEILEAAVDEIRAFLGTDRVKIYQLYPDGHGAVIAESIQAQRLPSLLGLHFPADDMPAAVQDLFIKARQRVIVDIATQQICSNALNNAQTGEPLPEADIRYRPVEACHIEYLRTMGVQSSLVIPILHHDTLWGLLVSHHTVPHDFTEEALDMAQLVADQLSIAIAQSTLLTQTRDKAHREAVINQIAASLHSLTMVDVQAALEATVTALKCESGRLYQVGSFEQSAKLYTVGPQPILPAAFQTRTIEEHILWQQYFHLQDSAYGNPGVYYLADLYKEPRLRVLASFFQGTALRGLLVVVLQYRQQVMGYLSLFRREIDIETIWAGQFDSDVRQAQPRNSFAAWKEEKRGQGVPWSPEDVELAQGLANHFAIALYQHQLYQQVQTENYQRRQIETTLRRQTEEDQLLAAILHRIRQSLSLEAVLDTTVAEVRQFLQTDRVLLYQFAADWSGEVVAESVSHHQLSILGQVINDPCFTTDQLYEPYREGRIGQISDISAKDIKPCYVELLNQLQVQANLVVPILIGIRPDAELEFVSGTIAASRETTQLWGLLIAHNCQSPRLWQSWEIHFLRQLAVQVAIALQQAELYHQLQQLNVNLEQQVQERTTELQRSLNYAALLQQITDQVRDSLDEHQILQTAVEALAQGLQTLCCDAALYDLEQHTAQICYEYTRSPIVSAQGLKLEMTRLPELYSQLLAGQTFQFCRTDSTQSDSMMRPLIQRYAIACCTLRDDQNVLGDLWLFKPASEHFDAMEMRVIQQVADQCAIALRQARLYQAAQAQVEELARLNHLKDDFLSTVSHELRTPMSSIQLATQMLEVILTETGMLEVESNKAAQYFQILNTECKREIRLINDLLDLTRLDAGTEPLAITTISLQIWIPHVIESFYERAAQQSQQLQLEVPADFPPFSTDLAYLERLLTELLNNACKYTPEGGTISLKTRRAPADRPPLPRPPAPELQAPCGNPEGGTPAANGQELSPSCQEPTLIQLEIINTGVEIPPEERDRVFERFYRIPNSDPWKHGGTGLGLALVKKMATYLGGEIRLESTAGETCFTITLPNLAQCPEPLALSNPDD